MPIFVKYGMQIWNILKQMLHFSCTLLCCISLLISQYLSRARTDQNEQNRIHVCKELEPNTKFWVLAYHDFNTCFHEIAKLFASRKCQSFETIHTFSVYYHNIEYIKMFPGRQTGSAWHITSEWLDYYRKICLLLSEYNKRLRVR